MGEKFGFLCPIFLFLSLSSLANHWIKWVIVGMDKVSPHHLGSQTVFFLCRDNQPDRPGALLSWD